VLHGTRSRFAFPAAFQRHMSTVFYRGVFPLAMLEMHPLLRESADLILNRKSTDAEQKMVEFFKDATYEKGWDFGTSPSAGYVWDVLAFNRVVSVLSKAQQNELPGAAKLANETSSWWEEEVLETLERVRTACPEALAGLEIEIRSKKN
jgi:hypothetical protein